MPRFAFWVLGSALTLSILTACGSDGNSVTQPPATTVHATISALPSSGIVPLATNVTVAVSGNATGLVKYHFDFGDGATLDTTMASPNYTPAHTYVSTGVYTAKTTVTREGVTTTSSTTIYVENVPPPPPPPTISVSATATPTSGFAPLSVAVTISVTGTATGPVTYRINFGDGVVEATSTQPTHTFNKVLANGGTTYTIDASAVREGVSGSAPTIRVTPTIVPPNGTRVRVNRPDERSGPKHKYVYMTPLGGIDRGLDTNGVLHNTIRASNNWMVNQTGWSPWVDEWSGEPDIIYVQSTMTAQQMDANGLLGSVKQQLAVDVNVTYVVFLEAASSGNCGQASTTRVAVLYLQSPGCNTLSFDGSPTGPPSPWARFTLHETFHSAGAVSAGAPDYDLEHGGHVKTTCDLMHYSMCQDVTIDATGRNYLGDNVPPGVVNIKNDPFFHFVRAPTPGLRAVGSDVPLRVPLWNDARRP